MRQSRDLLASASVERATLVRKPPVGQLATYRALAGLDVPQALTLVELGIGHRQILIPAGEVPRVTVSTIAGQAFGKLLVE